MSWGRTCPGHRKGLTHGAKRGRKSTRRLEREEEGKTRKQNARASLLSYSRTMVIERREDPLCGRHVIICLSQNGNCLLSTAWSDNGHLRCMGTYCKHRRDFER